MHPQVEIVTLRDAMRSIPAMRRSSLLLAGAAALIGTLTSGLPGLAQVSDANVRAVNLARNWAITNNGGLSVYVPAACMFETGNGGGSCLVQADGSGFRFRFLGGSPAWQVEGRAPNRETEIQISADGRSVVDVPYNGAPR